MKKILFIIIFHTAVFAINNPFKVGELLKYSAEWNGIKVGNAELFLSGIELFNDVETYQITFTTRPRIWQSIKYNVRRCMDQSSKFTFQRNTK